MIQSFKLSDGDVDAVLGALETYTGRIVLRPQALPAATYSLKIDRPIPKSELVLALETLLTLNQVGVSALGDKFLKVVPLAQVKSEAPEFIEGSTLDLPPSGKTGTKLFQLNFLRANEFFNGAVNGIFSPGIGNGVVVLEKANAAMITDTISNLQRIETLINLLDRPNTAGLTPKFYALHNAKASDLVNKLHTMLTGPIASQIGSATTYNADDRTNQVILLADAREQPFFDQVIAQLDIQSNPNTRNEVIYLKHADAKDVATLLSQLVSGQNSAALKSSNQSVRTSDVITGFGQNNPVPAPTPAAPAAAVAALPASLQNLANGASNEFSTLVTILPDERSNAVVVSGTVSDIRLIKDLISKIDIVLAQVRIEVIIAEVTLSDIDQSGITALGLTVGKAPNGGTSITSFTPVASTTTTASGGTSTAASGLSSVAGWDFSNGIVNPLAFNAMMNASSAGSKNQVKILSAPVIVTTHNKAAEVQVGEQLPIITGTQQSLVTAGAEPVTSSTVSYQTIAIDLKVTPLIGDDGNIQMTIDQKVDDIIGDVSVDGNEQPIIGHREASSFVTCQDGQMVVLGGEQRTQKTQTQNKLGFLYEIPILSQLLGGHTDDLERTELLLFIRPHVIPLEHSTADTKGEIKTLSNSKQVDQYLADPSKQTQQNDNKTQNFLDRFRN
jgi:general secretion pathway protein D